MEMNEIMNVVNNMDAKTYHCMGKVIFGHEIWLENAIMGGEKFSSDLRYGHNMVGDGKVPEKYVNPTVFDNRGNPVQSKAEEIPEGYRISFSNKGGMPYSMYIESIPVIWNIIADGTWKAGVKRDYTDVKTSASYQMYAKIIFAECEPPQIEPAILEIMPDKGKLHLDKEIGFTIKYEGKPLANKEVKMFCKESGEEIFKNTDADGKVSVNINKSGEWMFLVRHKDGSKCVENEFDESVFITTLVMRA